MSAFPTFPARSPYSISPQRHVFPNNPHFKGTAGRSSDLIANLSYLFFPLVSWQKANTAARSIGSSLPTGLILKHREEHLSMCRYMIYVSVEMIGKHSIPWLLMPWQREEPEHLLLWYWPNLPRIIQIPHDTFSILSFVLISELPFLCVA